MDPTPLRARGERQDDGCVLLRDIGLPYRDGGEAGVLRLLESAEPQALAAASDTLVREATTWAETYHLHPARSNIVRCLDLPPDARVLEIGAGCGAVTRYLGETCAQVDALEPVPARAAAARARTRDLVSTEVFIGTLDDVPAEPAYDVVVVIGVLEYVGDGTADPAPYRAFLQGIAERLVEGGSLVLAIENRLGVKYLAGAPEDHSDRFFDSVEGYPVPPPARTFARNQLHDLVAAAGLSPQIRGAFPDYKLMRAAVGEFPAAAQSLLYRIPQFPSPDWVRPRAKLADERSLWRTLVSAGLAADLPNSFLVLAGKGGPSPVWPSRLAARYYSTGRKARYTAQTSVERAGKQLRLVRTAVAPELAGEPGEIRIVDSTETYQPGQDLLEYLADHPDEEIETCLRQWLALLDEHSTDGQVDTLDLVPHNLIRRDDGTLALIDIEFVTRIGRDQVVRRGVFWMAHHLAAQTAPQRWPGLETVRDLAVRLGTAVGLDAEGRWLEPAVREELLIQLQIQNGPQHGLTVPEWEQRFEVTLRAGLDRPLAELPLGTRLPDVYAEVSTQAEHDRLHAAATEQALRGDVQLLQGQLRETQAAYRALENSPGVRVARKVRRALEAVRGLASRT